MVWDNPAFRVNEKKTDVGPAEANLFILYLNSFARQASNDLAVKHHSTVRLQRLPGSDNPVNCCRMSCRLQRLPCSGNPLNCSRDFSVAGWWIWRGNWTRQTARRWASAPGTWHAWSSTATRRRCIPRWATWSPSSPWEWKPSTGKMWDLTAGLFVNSCLDGVDHGWLVDPSIMVDWVIVVVVFSWLALVDLCSLVDDGLLVDRLTMVEE